MSNTPEGSEYVTAREEREQRIHDEVERQVQEYHQRLEDAEARVEEFERGVVKMVVDRRKAYVQVSKVVYQYGASEYARGYLQACHKWVTDLLAFAQRMDIKIPEGG